LRLPSSEDGLELGLNLHFWRLSRGVLHHQTQLGHDFDDVAGLQDEVALVAGGAVGRLKEDRG